MGRLILVDTSILIEAQRNSEYLAQLVRIQERLIISRITACELIFGARNTAEKKKNKELISFLPVIEINDKVSQQSYGLIYKYNLKMKTSIPDSLIAATAITHKMQLWTANTKHFSHIKELNLFTA